ncbi:MAG: dihydroorotate dehydrogenase [Bacillota bacterium]|nr:dihydroorotate dehydrogenase [Bacillota bacterium]
MSDLSVEIAGVTFENPIIAASGTFGFGREYGEMFSLNELGGISVKGLTLTERLGNKPPRIAETPSGILNSVGLQNPGVDVFLHDYLPELKKYSLKVIANIAGNTVGDYCEMAERISSSETDMIEMNISCPNVKEGGVAFGTSAKTVFEIVSAVKKHASKPLIVKLSPNVTDIAEIARSAEAAGADVLSLINTLLGMKIDVKTRKPILNNNVGGLSGPAVRPVAVRMVWQVKNAVKIPVIGMGGIATAEDALEFIIAGADAVSVGTAFFRNPFAAIDIKKGLCDYLDKNGIKSIKELTGSLILN